MNISLLGRAVPALSKRSVPISRAIRGILLGLVVPVAIVAPSAATAGPISSIGAFDVCSLLRNSEARSISNDPKVAKRGGPPGFMCVWNSPGGESWTSHDIVIFFFTAPKIRQIASGGLNGLDPTLAAAFQNGSPSSVFQAMRKTGQSCQGYAGNLPCAEIHERIALYKRANAYDYVVLIFAQRNEGHGDAGIIRLVLDAAHVANDITPRLP